MKPMFTKGIIFFITAGLFLFSSCSSNTKSKTINEDDPSIETIIDEKIGSNFEESFNPPSPDEVMAFFESTLVSYNSSILNDVNNVSNYFDSKSQALNLGIYLSDIAYMNLFANTAESIQYMETIFVLSEKLNISGAYSDNIISRLMTNLNNQDSTIQITEQIYFSLIDYLLENQRDNTLALISIGSYVEILHLALSSVEEYNPENEMIKQIADLNILLESIYLFAEKNATDPNVENAFVHLQKIKQILEQTNTTTTETTQTEGGDHKLVLSGGIQYEISEDSFNELKTEVERIRTLIIQ